MRLEPIKLTDGRAKPWQVSIPSSLSESGKRRRVTFRTKGEALALCETLRIRARSGIDFKALADMLPQGVTVLDAINFYNDHHNRRQQSATMAEAWAGYSDAKGGHSEATIREIRGAGRLVLPTLGEKLVCDVTLDDLSEVLADQTAWGIRRHRRILRTFFNWCGHHSRKWTEENPAKLIEPPRIEKEEVRVLENDEVRAILDNAGPDMLPFWILCIFCGLRTTEAQRAFWSDVNWEEAHVKVRQKKGKFVSRYVDLQPNALEWLEPFRGRSGVIVSSANFGARRRECIVKAGVKLWGNRHKGGSVDRHTFASNHLAHFNEIGSLIEQLGHTNDKMVRENYRRAVTRASASEFWRIRPKDADSGTDPDEGNE